MVLNPLHTVPAVTAENFESPITDPPQRPELRDVQTIVVKVGTNVLSTPDDQLDSDRIADLARQVCTLVDGGKRLILVSSGAIGAGMTLLGMTERPKDLAHLQAAAATGQAHLIHVYDRTFRTFGFHAAQLLVTANDFRTRGRYLNVRNTLRTLAEYRVIPILNENDTVSTAEIRLGDNDRLAAMVANALGADLMVILSVVDGMMTGDPRLPDSRRIPRVQVIDEAMRALVSDAMSTRGTGGMQSKLDAVESATAVGTHVVIAHGQHPKVLERAVAGDDVGTFFLAEAAPVGAWKGWIGFTLPPQGRLIVDAGARRAVESQGRSLLAIGITGAEGDFKKGEVVALVDQLGKEFARGMINYDCQAVRRIAGHRTADLAILLGSVPYEEVIHRDTLVITT